MNQPRIELIPLRSVISSEVATTLDLVIRITPETEESTVKRPPLNLGLVIDRSGSMSGEKLEYARQAACYAVSQLLPTDRVSVVSYDDQVKTLVPNTLVENKDAILRKIKTLIPGGTTALHQGWVEGSTQVSQQLNPEALNRVLLLSDGLANVGETNPDLIASDVKGLAQHGINTSTLGIGDDYNEDLMEAMANSGDGNYYYIEDPKQLESIFQNELQGLVATIGQKVTLSLTPQAGVILEDVFNDLETNNNGEYLLPNLVVGNPINIAVRLKVPAMATPKALCEITLGWNNTQQNQRLEKKVTLSLSVVSQQELENYPFNAEVRKWVTKLQTSRAKEEAIQYIDRGEYNLAQSSLQKAEDMIQDSYSCFEKEEAQEEFAELSDLSTDLKQKDKKKFRKKAAFQSYKRRKSK